MTFCRMPSPQPSAWCAECLLYMKRLTGIIIITPVADTAIAAIATGADPGAGKGRGTNRLRCRWFGRARFSC